MLLGIPQHLKCPVILLDKNKEEGGHLQDENRGRDQHPPGVLIEKEPEVILHKDQTGVEREKDEEETKESVVMKISNQDQDASQDIHQSGHQWLCLCHPAVLKILQEAGHQQGQIETLISD